MNTRRNCVVCNKSFPAPARHRTKLCGPSCRRIWQRDYQRAWYATGRPPRSKVMGWVYVVTDGHYVKIGWTKESVERRLEVLQVGSPHKLTLVASKRGTLDKEWDMHHTVRQHRYRGEWFTRKCLPAVRKALA